MSRIAPSANLFTTVRTEGGLLPSDLLARIAASGSDVAGLEPEAYGLGKGGRLNEAISRSWEHVRAFWAAFAATRESLPAQETGVSETREQWLLPLFRELGYGRLTYRAAAEEVSGRRYQISHRAGEGADAPPVHTVSFRTDVERLARDAEGGRTSPHGQLQEYLNRTDHLWGVVTNGLRLRILRDNQSLSRAAFVEFDLQAMMDGGVYADYVLLFVLLHRSRLPQPEEPATGCWLERWRLGAEERGARALEDLRVGVEAAIKALGQGFLEHPANDHLRKRLTDGDLTVEAYYRQLLRLVYRMLFLLAAEERDLLFEVDADPRAKVVYRAHYGLLRLRGLVEQRRHRDRYDDLWRSLLITFGALREDGAGVHLGLKPLAGGLFGGGSCGAIDGGGEEPIAMIGNARLLDAIGGLTSTTSDGVTRRINYRDMDVEELGSVYEGLLEEQPALQTTGDRPTFALRRSGERKTTGSYYTNRDLVRELIRSALEPVLAEAVARGRTPDEQRQSILDLKVCDPACGSGHFLLAAARRIGRELAWIGAGGSEPDPADERDAIRDAIAHCVYGVDLNPLAVDLCKVALWLEAQEPGRPLPFLDHHIRQGNSLVGATKAAMEDGIPDDAFDPVIGDDAVYARTSKKRNVAERKRRAERAKGQRGLEDLGWRVTPIDTAEKLRVYFAGLAADEANAADLDKKEAIFSRYRRSRDFLHKQIVADLWTTAFFWPLSEGEPLPPTDEVFRRLAEDTSLVDFIDGRKSADLKSRVEFRTVRRARALARAHDLFHWELEFEDVFGRDDPGFDVILGNPPWERIKLQEQEFFAARDPEIAGAPNAAARKRLIAGLATSDEVVKQRLYDEFVGEKRSTEAESKFLRQGGRFPLTGRGDVNTYSVFAELMLRLVSKRGRSGIIVPTGIATDDTNKFFFRTLVDDGRLVALYDFENREGVFPGVHRSYKFSLLTMSGRNRLAAPFDVAFFLTQPSQVHQDGRRFQLNRDDIALLNPNTKTCPIFRSERDAELTKKIYSAAPVLVREGPPEENPWGITFKTLFHMSNDSHLFRTRSELETAGFHLGADGRFRRQGQVWLPLYEAKMIHQFDHRFATYEGPAESERSRDLTEAEHEDPTCVALPRYWVPEPEVEHVSDGKQSWFVGFRNVARATDERSAIFSLLPWAAVGHSLQLLLPAKVTVAQVAALLANTGSLAFDFAVRQKLGGINFSFFIVKQLPVLPPHVYVPELGEVIVQRVIELVYTAQDLAGFARDCGYDGPPFDWDPERRAGLRAELDGIYAHLYGLNRDDFAYILDTFPIVRRKDETAFGEYRTKRLCLEAYDRFVGISQLAGGTASLVSDAV